MYVPIFVKEAGDTLDSSGDYEAKTFYVMVAHNQNIVIKYVNNTIAGSTFHVKGFHQSTTSPARPTAVPVTADATEVIDDIVHNSNSPKPIAANTFDTTMIHKADGSTTHYTHLQIGVAGSAETIDGGSVTVTFADADPDTITRGSGDWTSTFVDGQKIGVSGTDSNDGVYTIDGITATVITLVASDTLTAETFNSGNVVITSVIDDYDLYVMGIPI